MTDTGCVMSKIDEIMKLLAEAKRQADAISEPLLAYHIGTALLVAKEVALGQGASGPRR